MNKIQIFDREIADGVSEAVKAQASVAYCSEALYKPDNEMARKVDSIRKIIAENKNQLDLYYLEAVLVSVGWNKNDDVFLNDEAFAARTTPEDKQFNFMHDENDIIGHITGSYVIDKNGNVIASDATAPENFDIVTQAVIYNSWMNEDNQKRMTQIIAEIEEGGKWFVSMECLFSGFDYAVIDETGKARILERNEASAFLTKHLRCYGGEGKYEGLKLGRALRNISFSGKGLVSRPANPESVILSPKTQTTTAFFANATEKTINSIMGEPEMADDTKVAEKLIDLQTKLEAALQQNEQIKSTIEAAQAKKMEDLETALAEVKSTVAAQIAQIETATAQTEADALQIAGLEEKLVAADKAMKDAEDYKKKKEKEAKDAKRTASLVELGFDKDKAAETCASLDALEDEAFDAVVAVMTANVSAPTIEDTPNSSAELNLSDLDDVETTEASLLDGTDSTDESEKVRADVADWFAANVSRKS